MALLVRGGNKADFDKNKMRPREFGVALDSQEAFICFGAGITKKMATYEDYQDMIDDCVEITETAQGVVDSFNSLEIEKLAIDDTAVSLITGWSSDKISKHDTKDNVITFTEATTRDNIATGEKHSTIFSKVKKWFSDLKSVAFTGKYNDLTNVAVENPATLPTASADTLGKIYRDGTGLKITLRSGNESSYAYSWVPFISKDKVVNSFNVTEDGFVADARTVKVLNDGLNDVNNNLTPQLIDISNGDYGTVEYNGSYKSTNIVCIQVDISNITVSTLGWRNIGKISLGNRPSNGVSCSCFEIVTTEQYTVNIDFVGNINMYFNSPVSGKRVRIAGAYIIL